MNELSPADIAALLAKLGLDPATTDVAALLAKIEELQSAASSTALTDTANQLAAANAELEKVRGEYQALFDREQAAQKAKTEAEADAVLEQYAAVFANDQAKAKMRELLLSDRETAVTILEGLAERAAESAELKTEATPPPPQHDPEAPVELTPEDKVAKADALIAAIKREGKFTDYTAAREEARRRQPELFS